MQTMPQTLLHNLTYTTGTWYKLGNSLSASFKTACRAAETNWEALWGGGTQYFYFTEDTSPITDPYNRAIGMTVLPDGVLGITYVWDPNGDPASDAWHPYHWIARVNRSVHDSPQWCMRFQSNIGSCGFPCGHSGAWGDGSALHVFDRQSVATHEFGHVIGLMHPDTLRTSDYQTMMSGYVDWDRTGTFKRTPQSDDEFGLKKLYPSQL